MEDYQKRLFPYAYSILGSVEDAKDVVQEIMVKTLSQEKKVDNINSYRIRAVINQAINLKKKHKRIRAQSIWLPEPIISNEADSDLIRHDKISYSVLTLLENLSAKERAVFILKEGFDYAHPEIAELLEISVPSSRQLLSRSKKKIANTQKHGVSKQEELKPSLSHRDYMNHYVSVIKNGDVEKLEQLLVHDISLYADGGESVQVVSDYTLGKRAVAYLLHYVFTRFQSKQRIHYCQANGQPALLFYNQRRVAACQVFEIEHGLITNIYAVVDPDKLKSIL